MRWIIHRFTLLAFSRDFDELLSGNRVSAFPEDATGGANWLMGTGWASNEWMVGRGHSLLGIIGCGFLRLTDNFHFARLSNYFLI